MSETQLGKRAGKRNMNLMSKEFWAKTTRAAIDDPMTASLNWMQMTNLTWLTSCSCGCSGVVCDKVVCDKVVCDKVVCDKVVWERWCVWPHLWMQMTNLTWLTSCSCGCSGVVCDKVVCDKVVCDRVVWERWCVTKLWVKDGVRRSCVTDGVWQSCVWKMVCEIVPRLPRETAKPSQALDTVPWMPRLPRKTKVDVRLSHACHAKRTWMWDCATPATGTEGGCEIAPQLSRKVPQLCHACHAKCRGVTGVTGVTGD